MTCSTQSPIYFQGCVAKLLSISVVKIQEKQRLSIPLFVCVSWTFIPL